MKKTSKGESIWHKIEQKLPQQKQVKRSCMIDLHSGGGFYKNFSQHAAAKWLVENGKAKNMNCVSSLVLFAYANHVQQDMDITKKLLDMTGVL
jgi:UDP-N-acetylenolpyruvoylglucosamine reductase